MKKIVCKVFAFGLAVRLIAAPLTVCAYNFNFDFPDEKVGSMRSTSLYVKEAGTTPFVKQSINTLSTHYMLSPQRLAAIQATDLVTTGNTVKHTFSYRDGYGGAGGNYCLSGYPAVPSPYQAYQAYGSWSN